MIAIYKRELRAFFISPVAYVFLALFLAVAGYYFWGYQLYPGSGSFNNLFLAVFSIVIFITPLLTMRVYSEERRNRTDQALITAPVSLASIVAGKFLATITVFVLGQLVMLFYLWIVAARTNVDYAVFFGSYIGMLLVMMSLVSIGLFISSVTESQIIAAVGALAVSLLLYFIEPLGYISNNALLSTVASHIAFYVRYQSFTTGLLDPADIVYFVSIILLFNFLTARALERRRWV